MPAKHRLKLVLVLCLLLSSLLACDVLPGITITTGTPTTHDTSSHQSPPALNTWIAAGSGVELRYEHWKSAGNNEDTVVIARFAVHRMHISIGYQPHQPLLLSDWMKQTGALAVINGGYFDKNNQPTGLLVSDGHVSGSSYDSFGGMLSVDTGGNISLRSLHQQPYDPANEQLQQATQSSPMLMIDGKRTQFNANAASQRRSVVAMDKQRRMLFIVSQMQAFSLDELADLLASSDLDLQTALNLDGGASTGLYVNGRNRQVNIDPLSDLPIVIIVK